jgi:hypothetical protein
VTTGLDDGSRNLWIGIGIAAAAIVGVIVLLLLLGGDDGAAPTTTTSSTATTAAETTTTTAAETTTTTAAPGTTTTGPSGTQVAETPIVAVLQPYAAGGDALFPAGSVEAHWYQWEGVWVVLYRGVDADNAPPICPGNSIEVTAGEFAHTSNAPFNAEADEVCVDAPNLAGEGSGVQACGALLYYITEIPIEAGGALHATLEVNEGSGFIGQTGAVPADAAVAPEFTPYQAAYTLPASGVDEGGTVLCGS